MALFVSLGALGASWRFGCFCDRFSAGSIFSGRRTFADSALPIDLIELHRDSLAHALFLHCDAVKDVGDLHGALVVGDDDELALREEFLDDQTKALIVGF